MGDGREDGEEAQATWAAAQRTWRTRIDPLAEVWSEVFEQLEVAPGLEAKTLFAWL